MVWVTGEFTKKSCICLLGVSSDPFVGVTRDIHLGYQRVTYTGHNPNYLSIGPFIGVITSLTKKWGPPWMGHRWVYQKNNLGGGFEDFFLEFHPESWGFMIPNLTWHIFFEWVGSGWSWYLWTPNNSWKHEVFFPALKMKETARFGKVNPPRKGLRENPPSKQPENKV